MTSATETDRAFMRHALALAARQLGRVAPNPSVGCVIVKDGAIVGRGVTQDGGRPHAETQALKQAGESARGSTVYVSLEPCSHFGKTPPCAQALIEAGVARVVIACRDPDRRVDGSGIASLEAAGIAVTLGVLQKEAEALNAGFILAKTQGRPLVTLKLATSLDGKIATAAGESRWITGEAARDLAHGLRANHDAVLVGFHTASADDPLLDVRLPGMQGAKPVRIVVDARLATPPTHRVVKTAKQQPTWIACIAGHGDPLSRENLIAAGVEIIELPAADRGRIPIAALLQELARRGVTRLLVEGGGGVAASLVRADLVDRIVWFRGGQVIGEDGRPAIAAYDVTHLIEARRFIRERSHQVGEDAVDFLVRATT
jgi:diaminohydroxyphosphoribosylaminopyrimidine deaminase/5-amino-6-(5-phosphoribosylamino)uracil reductase